MHKNVDAGDVIREFYRQRQERTGQRPPSFRRPGVVQAAERFLERFKALEADDPFGYMRWRWDAAQHAGHPVDLGKKDFFKVLVGGKYNSANTWRVSGKNQHKN